MKGDFQFWGEDEGKDRIFWNALIAESFKDWLSDPREDEAWSYLQVIV